MEGLGGEYGKSVAKIPIGEIPRGVEIKFKVNDEKPEQVNHPAHYNNYPIEAIDMMVGIFGLEKTIDFCYMTALKYRLRLGHKDDINQDLAKEQWYLNKAKELTEHLNNSLDGSK